MILDGFFPGTCLLHGFGFVFSLGTYLLHRFGPYIHIHIYIYISILTYPKLEEQICYIVPFLTAGTHTSLWSLHAALLMQMALYLECLLVCRC